jgi:hypothetical protein
LMLIVSLNWLQDSLFSHNLSPVVAAFLSRVCGHNRKNEGPTSAESLAASDTETACINLMGGASDTFFLAPKNSSGRSVCEISRL